MNLKKLIKSFGYAIQGIINLLHYEQNARIHFCIAILVLLLIYFFNLPYLEAAIIFFAVALVFVVEITNSAIEKILDILHPQNDKRVAYIKDAMAGATLISAIIALVVGLIIFFPYFVGLTRP